MAVQKSRKSHSKKRMKWTQNALQKPVLSVDVTSGEKHLRHHVTPQGYLRGKKVLHLKQSNSAKGE